MAVGLAGLTNSDIPVLGSSGEAGATQRSRTARGLGFYFCNLTGAVDITTVRALRIYFPFFGPTGTGGRVVFHVDRAET